MSEPKSNASAVAPPGGDLSTLRERQLLELAAKAAGYEVRWHEPWQCFVHAGSVNIDNPPTLAGQRMVWVPLTDDGDALRLAVKLNLTIRFDSLPDGPVVKARAEHHEFDHDYYWIEWLNKDPLAATRRVIVRAAASLAGPTPTASATAEKASA